MNKFYPLVTVIIPVYNGSNYMKEAIDSALSQTYKNIEIIVVNDGSKDNTEEIALSYGNKIRYLKKENGGVATALNLAIQNAKGDYISWLSHDDVYHPDKIKKQIEALEKLDDKNTVIYSNSIYTDSKGEPIYKTCYEYKEAAFNLETPEFAVATGSISGCTLLIPKQFIIAEGMFKTDLRYTQDYDLWHRMLPKHNLKFIYDRLVMTRTHGSQDYQKASKKQSEEIWNLWSRMLEEFPEKTLLKIGFSKYGLYKYILDNFFLPQKNSVNHLYSIHELTKEVEKLEKEAEQNINTDNYKVSVIIPFYNRVDWTIEAVNSIKVQSHKNWEIILVNDDSTDEMTILQEICNTDSRIKLINNTQGKGVSSARNTGLDAAKGDFAALLDSDDLFTPDKLQKQLMFMLKHGVDFSYTNYKRFYENNKTQDIQVEDSIYINKCCEIAPSTVMLSKRIYQNKDYRFDTQMHTSEDICFFMNLSRKYPAMHMNEILTSFRMRFDSCCNDNYRQIIGIMNTINYMYKNLKLNINFEYYNSFFSLLYQYTMPYKTTDTNLTKFDFKNYKKLRSKYKKYGILRKVAIGPKRKKYKEKHLLLKSQIKAIENTFFI